MPLAPGTRLGPYELLAPISPGRPLMKSFVYGVPPADPVSIAVAAMSLIAVATVSAWLPARRAAGIDAAAALRAE